MICPSETTMAGSLEESTSFERSTLTWSYPGEAGKVTNTNEESTGDTIQRDDSYCLIWSSKDTKQKHYKGCTDKSLLSYLLSTSSINSINSILFISARDENNSTNDDL